jgi:hypothetical protein
MAIVQRRGLRKRIRGRPVAKPRERKPAQHEEIGPKQKVRRHACRRRKDGRKNAGTDGLVGQVVRQDTHRANGADQREQKKRHGSDAAKPVHHGSTLGSVFLVTAVAAFPIHAAEWRPGVGEQGRYPILRFERIDESQSLGERVSQQFHEYATHAHGTKGT